MNRRKLVRATIHAIQLRRRFADDDAACDYAQDAARQLFRTQLRWAFRHDPERVMRLKARITE